MLAAVRLGAVLDHRQVVAIRDLHDARHVGREAEDVDDDDGRRARRDLRLDRLGVERERVRVDVGEDGDREVLEDATDGGAPRERRGDHLVAGLHAGAVEREHQRRRPAVHRQPVLSAVHFGE